MLYVAVVPRLLHRVLFLAPGWAHRRSFRAGPPGRIAPGPPMDAVPDLSSEVETDPLPDMRAQATRKLTMAAV